MKIAGEHLFPFSRREVWEALMDPTVLAGTLPGCERLEQVGDGDYRGALNVQVGPVKGRFEGSVRLSRMTPPESSHIELQGQGPAGFLKGNGSILLEDSEGGTLLRYDLDTQVGGRVAGVGQRLLESSAKVITRQGLEGLESQLEARAAGGDAVRPSGDSSRGGLAVVLAKGLAAELVPPERRPLVVGVIAAALLAAVVLILRSCG